MKILGVDLGITSVGWALVDDKSNKIIDSGVLNFCDTFNW